MNAKGDYFKHPSFQTPLKGSKFGTQKNESKIVSWTPNNEDTQNNYEKELLKKHIQTQVNKNIQTD